MSEIWMFTAPAKKGIMQVIAKMYREYDGKRYTIGLEKGRGGYRHLQGRVELSANTEIEIPVTKKKTKKTSWWFEACKKSGIHTEKSEQWVDYEGKDGYFIASTDNHFIRMQRFGNLTEEQKQVLRVADGTNDREVVVWFDRKGNVGKSWLCKAMHERRLGFYIDKTNSAEGMVKDLESATRSGERRPYVLIDIPRSSNWEDKDYIAIEKIKDGLVTDPRYGYHINNLSGIKVIVMCNYLPERKKLSKDRWKFIENKDYLLYCGKKKTERKPKSATARNPPNPPSEGGSEDSP